MATAELLQVQNYGIAGHYNPHWDHQIKRIPGNIVLKDNGGNRIATMLIYVSCQKSLKLLILDEIFIRCQM
jgi:prolyl 4-hydroxylase